jgi:ornithine cyclodeaminase
MNLRIIDAEGVKARLPIATCIEALADAIRGAADATIIVPQRTIMPLATGDGLFAAMPGASSSPAAVGAKIMTLKPQNPGRGLPAIQGVVLLFDPDTGAPSALLDGAAITAIRTAAVSGLATRLLSREDARTVGILGYGVQAETHVAAMLAVRHIEKVVVWGRSPDKTRAFADLMASRHPVAVTSGTIAEASACDIVCAVTSAQTPILLGQDVRPGAHVNLVGAHSAQTREADSALMASGRIYVDDRAAALAEAGDILIPISEGVLKAEAVLGDLADLLSPRSIGSRDTKAITIFKSVGLALQDLIAAAAALRDT